MTQKPMLRAEVGMRVRCANKASAVLKWTLRPLGFRIPPTDVTDGLVSILVPYACELQT